jgi:hypothetical protein
MDDHKKTRAAKPKSMAQQRQPFLDDVLVGPVAVLFGDKEFMAALVRAGHSKPGKTTMKGTWSRASASRK